VHARYRRLTARGKNQQQAITAVGRELLGFIWAIGVQVEAEKANQKEGRRLDHNNNYVHSKQRR
jgi:hypothetical protein